MTKKGVVLLALGDPRVYSKYAYNLAVSIKQCSPETEITIVYNSGSLSHLDEIELFHFDRKIICPPSYYTTDGRTEYVKAKLYLDKLTPYEKTIFFDVDMVFSPYKKMNTLWSELDGLQFTMACRGESEVDAGQSAWVDLSEIKQYYGFTSWYDLSSEVIYFEKSDLVNKIFEDARTYYHQSVLNVREFAGGKPDEPFFCLSMLSNNIRPHLMPYKPSYWEYANGDKGKYINEQDLWNNYYLLSMGGKVPSPRIEKIYNNAMKYYGHNKGVGYYDAIHKGKFLTERSLI